MKFIQTLVPIASLALAVSGESPLQPAGGKNGVNFSQGGVDKVLDFKANGSKGDIQGVFDYVEKFFRDNPTVWKSIMKVVHDPKNKKVKEEISNEGLELYYDGLRKPESDDLKVKAINYVYKHPEILTFAGEIGKQVNKDNPTLIENGFAALEKAAAKNPGLFKKIRAKAIAFSDKNEAAHEKIVELTLKYALKDVKLASKISTKALKLDQIICSGDGSAECDCGSDTTYGKPDTKVDPETPDVTDPVEPEEVEYARPDTKVDPETPEVTDPVEPTPYPEETYGKPDTKVDPETPEVTDPVGPVTEPEVTYGKPDTKVDPETPEVTDPVGPVTEPEVTYGKPDTKVDPETPEVTDPVGPVTEPEVTYGRPSGQPKTIMDPK